LWALGLLLVNRALVGGDGFGEGVEGVGIAAPPHELGLHRVRQPDAGVQQSQEGRVRHGQR